MGTTIHTQDLEALTLLQPVDLARYIDSDPDSNPLEILSSDQNNFIQQGLLHSLLDIYGADLSSLQNQIQRIGSLSRQFTEFYGDGPIILLRAPARINILGEHVDYVSYLPTESLPFGSREHDMLMLVRPSNDDRVRGASSAAAYPPFSFAISDGPTVRADVDVDVDVDSAWVAYLFEHPAAEPHWSNYVKGPAYFTRLQSGDKLSRGIDFVVDSGIPAGGGASSSSALVVLANAALRFVNNIPSEPLPLARDSAKAEWYVGTRGGAMDHITICLAKLHQAVNISYATQTAQQITLPGHDFRWVTFFSEPADKGREIMIEYNERAAVSRIVLPALIDGWNRTRPSLFERWQLTVKSTGTMDALEQLGSLINELPETLTFTELQKDHPEAYAQCAKSFPTLIAERSTRPLQVRSRALHHLGEIKRVKTATSVLLESSTPTSKGQEEVMRVVGTLLNQSHDSLRDLYQVSTAEVERLIGIIQATPGVYGARLMGGGFGGNILVLTKTETVNSLVQRVQAEYYGPKGREGVNEGSVMISTPGDGLAQITPDEVWREAINAFNSLQDDGESYRTSICNVLDALAIDNDFPVWPIIVAAGKGTRSLASGLTTPKPLAPVCGIPAINHVIQHIKTAFRQTRTPIVIVSPETESAIRDGIKEEVIYVVQDQALGTGDAVMCAQSVMENFSGLSLVIWGTQPVIQPETMLRATKLASLFSKHEMIVPTAHKDRPYAPLTRDAKGNVESARETHLEQAEQIQFGESNIGMFLLKSEPMFQALRDLHERYWDETQQRYDRPSGELGFPNELINYFAARHKVFACPIANSREEQGIKTLSDVERCERFIAELSEAKKV